MKRARNSRGQQLIAGLICLALAYILASKAIDSGRWLYYFLTFVVFGLGVKLLVRTLRSHGRG